MLKNVFTALLIFLFSNLSNAEENLKSTVNNNQHEINYGLIGVSDFAWIDLDTSSLPILGMNYKYYFEPLPEKHGEKKPYQIKSDLNRISWVSFDFNFITDFSPNIGGNWYINDQWSLETDLIFSNEKYKTQNTTREESKLSIDFAINYQFTDSFQFGFGARQFSENSEIREELDDRDNNVFKNNESESSVFLQMRYTDINNGVGWDHKSSLSNSNDVSTFKQFSTLYTSQKNGLTFGFIYLDKKGTNDDFYSLSFSHNYWFSKNNSITYGVSINRYDNDDTFPLISINGTHRF